MTKAEFKQPTYDLFLALGLEPPSDKLLHAWWAELEYVELNALKTAYDAIIDLKATPTLENVLMRVEPPKNPIVEPTQHLKNKDKIPEPANYRLNGDGKDWARKILNNPKNCEAIAIKNAKIALNIKA